MKTEAHSCLTSEILKASGHMSILFQPKGSCIWDPIFPRLAVYEPALPDIFVRWSFPISEPRMLRSHAITRAPPLPVTALTEGLSSPAWAYGSTTTADEVH